ncbi:MAG: C4-dicarboxylate ABC transporter, partial [Desulfobacterota bacterium]|nr:C4-dicarboxylate ABC transporter [Thermodesulfobacteriota bacterium]
MSAHTRIRGAIAEFPPAYFSMVMATGIVSIAAMQEGFPLIARSLMYLNTVLFAILWGITLARLVVYPTKMLSDLSDHLRAPGFFTVIAATCVLGSQFIVLRKASSIAAALLAAGLVLWLV